MIRACTLYGYLKGYKRIIFKKKVAQPLPEGVPYYIRFTDPVTGKRGMDPVGRDFNAAVKKLHEAEEAARIGGKVPTAKTNSMAVATACENFLAIKSDKASRSIARYKNVLKKFQEYISVEYVDQITIDVLRKFKAAVIADGYAMKTFNTDYAVVRGMMKKAGSTVCLPCDEVPKVEESSPIPYSEDQLAAFFDYMTPEQYERYQFFLNSACRQREVTFASWADLNWDTGEYHICSKPDVKFSVKNHEDRLVPLPSDVMNFLRARRKRDPKGRWIFLNGDGSPEHHFLEEIKRIARDAGLNCGHCVVEHKMDGKARTLSCDKHAVCEHIILHRFRKTCATRWHHAKPEPVPLKNIQLYLGHKDLSTTQIYLGVKSTAEVRSSIENAAWKPKPRLRAVGD